MMQVRPQGAISPVVGVILLVAVTVILSAGVGLFVLDQQPPDSMNTGTGVTVDESDEGVEVSPVTIESDTIEVRRNGQTLHQFEQGDIGDSVPVPVLEDDTVTVVGVTDGTETVLTSATASDSSIVAEYTFEETSGDAEDTTGDFPGTVSADVTRGVSGVSGNAYEFTNGTDTTVVVDKAVIPERGTFTISMWIQTNEVDGTLFDMTRGSRYFNTQFDGTSFEWRYEDEDDADIQLDATLDSALDDGEWHHIAVVGGYHREMPNSIYIDGEHVLTEQRSTGDSLDGKPALNDFTIGTFVDSYGSSDVTKTEYDGRIDEVRVVHGGGENLARALCAIDAPDGHPCAS